MANFTVRKNQEDVSWRTCGRESEHPSCVLVAHYQWFNHEVVVFMKAKLFFHTIGEIFIAIIILS